VHAGALGWNGFLTFGMLYYLVPVLYRTKLHSEKLANFHFWTGTVGILLYMISMWTSGITQGLMWRAIDETGHLVYPDFVETVLRIAPLFWVRALGGLLFIVGFLAMCYNLYVTIKLAPKGEKATVYKAPALGDWNGSGEKPHRKLEGLGFVFSVLSFLAILVGSMIELVPTLFMHTYIASNDKVAPYTALELAGRDIYVREGCYVCHSQQIRPMAAETLRYGQPSMAEESMWDHPFQWGSKRTGPDLARVGGKYPDLWHFRHMIDPRATTPNSIMPPYPWLHEQNTNFDLLEKKFAVMKTLGVPYTDADVKNAPTAAREQAKAIAAGLAGDAKTPNLEDREIIALIAYLQRLGKNPKLFENVKVGSAQ
jgi:cytochrome c oxidase cbb3-type subunit I/II